MHAFTPSNPGWTVDYRHTTAEAMAEAGEQFDVVLNMEVVEHVADPLSLSDRHAAIAETRRVGDMLHHQPQPEILCYGDHRGRGRHALAAAGNA